MPLAGRVGDQAKCPVCKNEGPGKEGSPDTFINSKAALRVGDPGKHAGCGGDGTWKAEKGGKSVFINGQPAHRVGDAAKYGGGDGQLVEGSQNVQIGDKGGGQAAPVPHDKSMTVSAKDAVGRSVSEAQVKVSCPHKDDVVQQFTGTTTVSGLCKSATVTVSKPLQKGEWDPGGSSGEVFPPKHAHVAEKAAPGAPSTPSAPAAASSGSSSGAGAGGGAGGGGASSGAAPAAAPDTHVVHAPVSPGTAPDNHQAQIVRPTQPTANVQITTVHNYVELVYKAFGYTMPTAATDLAILGVREASLSGKNSKDGEDTLEAEMAAGKTDQVTETRDTRDATFSTSAASADATTWNDLLFVAFTPSTPDKVQHVEVFECTIDAGNYEKGMSTPVTLEGKLYDGHPGDHHFSKYPLHNCCLNLYYGSAGKMALARECTHTRRTFEEIASAKNGTGWVWASVENNASIHMHFGQEGGKVGGWSTGCTVLRHHLWIPGKSPKTVDPNATRYKRFMDLFNAAANKQKIPYLVVSSQYVRSYAEWVRYLDQNPGESAKPESVIMKDKLVAAPGAAGKYLPSFVTAGFAKAVNDLAADPSTSPTHAANLKSSLELVTMTLSI